MAYDHTLDILYSDKAEHGMSPFEYDMRAEQYNEAGELVRLIEKRKTVWTTSHELAQRLVMKWNAMGDHCATMFYTYKMVEPTLDYLQAKELATAIVKQAGKSEDELIESITRALVEAKGKY